MAWKKLGHVFTADRQRPWMVSHASTPFAVSRSDHVRCYFSARDDQNRSHIAYLDFDPAQPRRILNLCEQPLLAPGRLGAFDDSGVSMMQIVEHDGRRYLYYLGWNLGVTVPFRNSVGLAVAESGSEDFTRISEAPILDRHHLDPLTISSPWVLVEENKWKMWYGSHIAWETGGMDMVYVIKYAVSGDGIHWHRTGDVALNVGDGESAVVRPCVIHEGGLYHMWYSRRMGRKETSRLGYAQSADGIHWQRLDERMNLDAGDNGWDREMLCYPCVFDHQGRRYMVYNGNGFGRTGFGLAVFEP